MNELHLFAGAGGGILGGMLLGHTCVCAVEIEPYPRKVLLQRQRDGILPKFPIWDDVTTFDGKPWRGKVDVVCGGFPCQDISAAGKGAGLSGKRSGLWSEMQRIIGEVGPRFVFVENSPMLTIRGLGVVLGDLAGMGYNAKWGVLGNDSVNGWCKRKRIWILAGSSKDGFYGGQSERNKVRPQEIRQNKPDYTNRIWSEADRCLSIGDWKEFTAKFCRMDDGLDNRVDRISAIGNGQVPAVAALAWKVLGGPGHSTVTTTTP
jgi:DNA (cytosine-5)-methyltransferase 1